MKKNSKKLLIFGMTSLMLMTGCKKTKIIEKNGETYLLKGGEYVSLKMEPKVFEPGTHFITYKAHINHSSDYGWNVNVVNNNFPDIPEGYKYVNSTVYIDGGIYHIYVNEVPVEVEPSINKKTGEIEYNNIGKPVKKLILE